MKIALPNNEAFTKNNIFGLGYLTSHRDTNLRVSNVHLENYTTNTFGPLGISSKLSDQLVVENLFFKNFYTETYLMSIFGGSKSRSNFYEFHISKWCKIRKISYLSLGDLDLDFEIALKFTLYRSIELEEYDI